MLGFAESIGGRMDETIIQIAARGIKFANLSDPSPEPGVTRLQVVVPDSNSRRFAIAALAALETAGYEIVKRGS